MRRRTRLASIAFAALSAAGMLVALLPSSAAAAPAVNCIQNPTANDNGPAEFRGTGVNIRTGPFTTCTSVGLGQPAHSVIERCTKTNSNGVDWTYLTDRTTGKTGWSQTSLVRIPPVTRVC
jgi:hypothetical protein